MNQPLTIAVIIIAYLALWLALSCFSSRNADNRTFFSGNRKMPWPLVAIAMIGAPITGVTFVSVPGMIMGKGFSYMQMGLGFIVGYFVIAFVLVPIYYRHNIISIYGYLKQRFGVTSYRTGAWLFFISKILGISIRFLIVCIMLQLLVFDPLGIPYVFCVVASLAMVCLSTYKGGVKSVIWGDVLKSVCLLAVIILCLIFISQSLGLSPSELIDRITQHPSTRVFYFDDPMDAKYFWKQFIAGIFIVIAMTGLDQDMMQRTLACKSARESRKNLIVSTFMQFGVTSLLLVLGVLLLIFLETKGETLPQKSDNLFAMVAFHQEMPSVLGVLFVIGIISATFSAVASALTSMTTTMTIDIMGTERCADKLLTRRKNMVHTGISCAMAVLVIFFFYLNEDDAISTVYTLISYTDGPILGLFTFGIFSRRKVNERYLPAICIAAPVISWVIQWSTRHFFAYETGFELLIINAFITIVGLRLLSYEKVPDKATGATI